MRLILKSCGVVGIVAGLSIAYSGHFRDSKYHADIYGWQARLFGVSLAIFGYYLFKNPDIDRK